MAGVITSPQEHVYSVDQMDRALDQLRIVWHALHSSVLADGDADMVANALDVAIRTLEPVRELLNEHGEKLPNWKVPARETPAGKAVQP